MATDYAPRRIAVMTSHSAPGIERLLADPNRGTAYRLVAVLGSEKHLAEAAAIEQGGVPLILRPFRDFQRERHLPLRSLHARYDYDLESAEILRRFDTEYVLLVGYRYVVTDPLLEAYPQRLIALYDSDLMWRRYRGVEATRESILWGEQETRASAFLVTRQVCDGPLFLLSGPYPVAPMARDAYAWGDIEFLSSYAELHRRWVVRDAFGKMLPRLAEIISASTNIQVVGNVVWVDGAPGPCRLGEAPLVCHDAKISAGIPSSCPFMLGA